MWQRKARRTWDYDHEQRSLARHLARSLHGGVLFRKGYEEMTQKMILFLMALIATMCAAGGFCLITIVQFGVLHLPLDRVYFVHAVLLLILALMAGNMALGFWKGMGQ